MKLREGIEFGNGDPLTAEAVRFSVERLAALEVVAAAMAQEVASMDVIDDHTIVFTLVRPWAGFLYYFAHEGGIVVNPTVVEAMGEDFPNPVGAGVGPYEVERFAPDEEIVLRAKDDYWGGPVCIQSLRFVTVPGAQATYDAFRAGELDAMFLADPQVIADAKDAAVGGQGWISGGSGYLLNSGRSGSPVLADLRLRQAIAHALDLDTINERVFGGTGLVASGLTHPDQQIYAGVDGLGYDPDRARELVEEVKAEGEWDGTVRLTCNDTPEVVEQTITTEAMLEAVGFEVEPENLPTADANQKILLEGNYDIGCGQASVFEESPLRGLNQFRSDAPNNRVGFGDPDLDRAIERLYEVGNLEETAEAMLEVQEIWDEHVPAVWLRAGEWFIGWQDAVHGLALTRAGVVMFHDAYLE
jgi:peptide/nickel transport system substrate-binding protein